MNKAKPRILCVDDEPNVLDSFSRLLRKDYDINVATSGAVALKLIEQNGPYAVVVSDYKMPGMNGVEFLTQARVVAPDTVRIMLTGQADEHTAVDAINDGRIFRFLNKPITSSLLVRCLNDGIDQYRLVTAEKDILEKTLKGSIQVMTEILSLTNPLAFSRATRIADYARQLGAQISLNNVWQVEVAAMLLHMGYVSIPNATLEKKAKGRELLPEENRMFEDVFKTTETLIGHISRLDKTLSIIKMAHGEQSLAILSLEDEIAMSAAVLRAVLSFDELLEKGFTKSEAIKELLDYQTKQNSTIVRELKHLKLGDGIVKTRQITVSQLRVGMVLSEAIQTEEGLTVAPKGYKVNELIRQLLKNLYLQDTISEYVDIVVNETED